MDDGLVVEMMAGDFILWRCLHGGPLARDNLERCEPNPQVDWPAVRARNVPLLRKLTEVYGSCAVIAREGDRIIGMLRFYPRAVCAREGSVRFCLQQPPPFGPEQDLAETAFRPPEELEDRTLAVHCMTAGQRGARDDPHRRKGLGTRMVRALAEWARPRGWRALEATAYVDLDTLYAISGAAGRTFWEKLGFRVAARGVEPELEKESDFRQEMLREAAARGIAPDRLADTYTMRLEL